MTKPIHHRQLPSRHSPLARGPSPRSTNYCSLVTDHWPLGRAPHSVRAATCLSLAVAAFPAFGAEPASFLQPVLTTNYVVVTNIVVVTNYVTVSNAAPSPRSLAFGLTNSRAARPELGPAAGQL